MHEELLRGKCVLCMLWVRVLRLRHLAEMVTRCESQVRESRKAPSSPTKRFMKLQTGRANATECAASTRVRRREKIYARGRWQTQSSPDRVIPSLRSSTGQAGTSPNCTKAFAPGPAGHSEPGIPRPPTKPRAGPQPEGVSGSVPARDAFLVEGAAHDARGLWAGWWGSNARTLSRS